MLVLLFSDRSEIHLKQSKLRSRTVEIKIKQFTLEWKNLDGSKIDLVYRSESTCLSDSVFTLKQNALINYN